MSRPVPEFVQGGGVIACGVMELLRQRQRDGVGTRAIKRLVAWAVLNFCAAGRQDGRSTLRRIPGDFLGLQRRQTVDLAGMKHRAEKHLRARQAHRLFYRLAILVQHGLAVVVELVALIGVLPVLDGRAFFASAHLRADALRLLVGHPARVAVACHHEVDGVDAAIAFAGGEIHRQQAAGRSTIPRLLPRGSARFQLGDQLVCHLLVKLF